MKLSAYSFKQLLSGGLLCCLILLAAYYFRLSSLKCMLMRFIFHTSIDVVDTLCGGFTVDISCKGERIGISEIIDGSS